MPLTTTESHHRLVKTAQLLLDSQCMLESDATLVSMLCQLQIDLLGRTFRYSRHPRCPCPDRRSPSRRSTLGRWWTVRRPWWASTLAATCRHSVCRSRARECRSTWTADSRQSRRTSDRSPTRSESDRSGWCRWRDMALLVFVATVCSQTINLNSLQACRASTNLFFLIS